MKTLWIGFQQRLFWPGKANDAKSGKKTRTRLPATPRQYAQCATSRL